MPDIHGSPYEGIGKVDRNRTAKLIFRMGVTACSEFGHLRGPYMTIPVEHVGCTGLAIWVYRWQTSIIIKWGAYEGIVPTDCN